MELAQKLWAKKNENQGRLQWLSLAQHLDDTQNIIVYLWDNWLNPGQRRIISQSVNGGDEEKARNLARFLGAVHDIGKATPAFQLKKGFTNSNDLDFTLLERLEQAGFDGISTTNLAFPEKSPHNLAGEALLVQYGLGYDLASIIGGHHGKPTDTQEIVDKQGSYKSNYYQADNPACKQAQAWIQAQEEILAWALDISDFAKIADLPQISQPAQVLLSGLLITADWIASNERYFPLNDLHDESIDMSGARAQAAWQDWFKTHPLVFDYFDSRQDPFNNRFGFSPRDFQAKLIDLIDRIDQPGIFVVEAPMGLGKTEAALVASEFLAKKLGLSGLYFGLPTQATSNGIFSRIKDWLDKVSKEYQENVQIRLSHGKSALNENFAGLARNIDPDGDGQVFVNEWFGGRKTSALDDFVVGTVDQLLMMALKQKHLALRHLGFSKKVVVIDEVHAYDAYMSQYLARALEWLGAYQVPVIILSATLPEDQRINLVYNYLLGKYPDFEKSNPELLALKGEAYPLMTYSDGDELGQVKDFEKESSKQIIINRLEDEDLVPLLEASHQAGAIAGIVVNTVKRAQELAKELADRFGADHISLLHSSFIATDRAQKEADLLSKIGKKGSRPQGHIVVGTQVIEQSLDIDFDLLISDLAPMDLLIQRIGRLHRHDISRPTGYDIPVTYILGMSDNYDFEPGSRAVYGDYLLIRSQELLPDKMEIPGDISRLVQETYRFGDLGLSGDLDQVYQDAKRQSDKLLADKEARAKTFLLADPDYWEDLFSGLSPNMLGWLNSPSQDKSEEKSHAQVRDTQETIEVVAVKQISEGYGFFDKQEDISHDLDNFQIGEKLAQSTLKLPNILSRNCNIDKTIEELEAYNELTLRNWQDQAWLRGSLGIIFDDYNQFRLNGYLLTYDRQYGLQVEKEEESGKV